MNLIELNGIQKSYDLGKTTVTALRGVDLAIAKGEFTVITGPSGSGKTTLLNIVGCLDRATAGHYALDGLDVSNRDFDDLAEIRNQKIGFIFQNFNLVSVLTALENVMLSLQIRGGRTADIRNEAAQRLDDVGLADFMRHRPDKLSGGQRQRVAIARALVTKPLLVLADEPTANLDHETAQSIIDLMKEMNEKEGVTFLFSTHDQRLINEVKRVVRIDDGKII